MRASVIFVFVFFALQSFGQSTAELFSKEGLKFSTPNISSTFNEFIVSPSTYIYAGKVEFCDNEFFRYRYAQKPELARYLRVDENKVYFSFEGGQCDNEYLIFDFGLEVGETFSILQFSKYEDYTVTVRDSVELLNGEKRVRLKLKYNQYERTWINGIGDSRNGIDFNGPALSCVNNGEEVIYKGSSYFQNVCDSIGCIFSFADFEYRTENLSSTFSNESLYAVSNTWDFGDGNVSTEINPVHEYAEEGCYDVILTTTDSCFSYSREAEVVNNVCLDNAWKRFESTQYINFHKILEFNDIIYALSSNEIYRSDDYLETTDVIKIPLPEEGRRYIRDIRMFDNQRGIIICSNFQTNEDRVAIFYTENAGATWKPTEVQGSGLSHCEVLKDGIALVFDSHSYFRTIDYGITWSKIDLDSDWVFNHEIQFIDDALVISNGLIKIHMNNSYTFMKYLFKSTDLGLTWDTISTPREVAESHFIDSNFGFGYGGYTKELSKTEDGGLTWEVIEQSIDVSEMYFLDNGVGFVNTRNGKTFHTENFMEDYTTVQCGPDQITSISGEGPDRLWAIKKFKIVSFRPEPIIDCVKTSVDPAPETSDVSVYPNPTENKITIQGDQISTVSIFSSVGKYIDEKHFDAISKTVEIDLTSMQKGVYFLNVRTKSGDIITKKVIKI